MNDYNRLIASMMLGNVDGMIDNVPQPTMFGGKRQRDFVLPASTDYSYPGTLAVGSLGKGAEPKTLGGTFWRDFGETEFLDEKPPDAYKLEGGKGSIGKELGMLVAKEAIKEGIKQGAKYAMSSGAGRRRRGRPSKKKDESLTEEIYRDVLVPEGKELLRMYIRSMMSGEPAEYGGSALPMKGRPKKTLPIDIKKKGRPVSYDGESEYEGGALIRDVPSQFHSSVYPPALASYTATVPYGHDAYGRGRGKAKKAKLPKSGVKRNSARGAIVAEIMKKHGLSLAAASKYVKEKNLY